MFTARARPIYNFQMRHPFQSACQPANQPAQLLIYSIFQSIHYNACDKQQQKHSMSLIGFSSANIKLIEFWGEMRKKSNQKLQQNTNYVCFYLIYANLYPYALHSLYTQHLMLYQKIKLKTWNFTHYLLLLELLLRTSRFV